MPTGSLPSEGKKIFEKVYDDRLKACQDKGGSKDSCQESAAKQAWGAVHNAGWSKDASGKWSKKAELTEFSLVITKASFDKATQEMRWLASASDTGEDSYGDNMTHELFQDFLSRIEANELAPEEFRSDFWQGGKPYLSISHYLDLNGDAVPGNVEVVYVDGDYLKAKGTYNDTPLGRACFRSICDDLYGKERSSAQDRVRISIAFLDWVHKHKSNGFIFERKSLDDFCPECLRELVHGEHAGISYLKGQLVHLAHTRVPVNKRTLMEVDRAMTTKKEDAASIVGKELADELEEKSKLVGKSEALVIKAEDEDEKDVTSTTETASPIIEESESGKSSEDDEDMDSDSDDEYDGKDKKSKKKVDKSYVGEVAVVSTPEYYRPFGGATSMKDAKAVIEAQHEKMRISDLWYALQSVIENISLDETVEDKAGAMTLAVEEFKDMMADKSASIYNSMVSLSLSKPTSTHPLHDSLERFKADYDAALGMADITPDDKLRLIQQSFDALGQTVIETIRTPEPVVEPSPANDMVKAFSDALRPLMDQIGLIAAEVRTMKSVPAQTQQPVQPVVPQRRSIPATPQMQLEARSNITPGVKKSDTPHLRSVIERTT